MAKKLNRRDFVKSSILASAAVPAALQAQPAAPGAPAPVLPREPLLPTGKIGNLEVTRLILGGNLISGYAHARELSYVSMLMRRYNTPAKIRETLELAESQGINTMNSWVVDDNSQLFDHWKNGGKLQWIAQTRLDSAGEFSQVQRAIDEGAAAVHLTGDTCEGLLRQGKFDTVIRSLEFIRARKKPAGIAGHDLGVIKESERLKLAPDFYLKTFHSHDYFTAPREGETDALGKSDNSWCSNPAEVVEVMAKVTRPWIAFKVLAAGAIPPRAAFPYAFNSGADFILVGMFDWQVVDNAKFARRVVAITAGTDSKRTRPWIG